MAFSSSFAAGLQGGIAATERKDKIALAPVQPVQRVQNVGAAPPNRGVEQAVGSALANVGAVLGDHPDAYFNSPKEYMDSVAETLQKHAARVAGNTSEILKRGSVKDVVAFQNVANQQASGYSQIAQTRYAAMLQEQTQRIAREKEEYDKLKAAYAAGDISRATYEEQMSTKLGIDLKAEETVAGANGKLRDLFAKGLNSKVTAAFGKNVAGASAVSIEGAAANGTGWAGVIKSLATELAPIYAAINEVESLTMGAKEKAELKKTEAEAESAVAKAELDKDPYVMAARKGKVIRDFQIAEEDLRLKMSELTGPEREQAKYVLQKVKDYTQLMHYWQKELDKTGKDKSYDKKAVERKIQETGAEFWSEIQDFAPVAARLGIWDSLAEKYMRKSINAEGDTEGAPANSNIGRLENLGDELGAPVPDNLKAKKQPMSSLYDFGQLNRVEE